jgi:hypothetical protein
MSSGLLDRSTELLPGYRIEPETGAWLTLPWPEDPDEREALARRSIGPQVIDWSEGRSPDGSPGLIDHLTGRPWRWTPGQKRFLILWYEVRPDGRWRYRSGVKRGAKGTGKDPMCAAWLLCELIGPTQLDGWSDDDRPIGVRHRLPLVQIAANSEAQAKDVLRVANGMVSYDARTFYGIDTGDTRTIVQGGGRLELLTASEKSSEGDPATAIGLNESHHMTESSGGHKVAAVARRNVGKSPATIQARVLEFTNAHQSGSDSTAEQSFTAWQIQTSGAGKRQDILYDSREAPPDTDLWDDTQRMAGLHAAYADAPWADLERLSDEILDNRTSIADAVRYYLNGLGAAEDAWIDPAKFDALARADEHVDDREQIAMFLDCSKSSDATGLVACRISDGYVFVLGVWSRPHGDRGKTWLVPRPEVDASVRAAFERFKVVWFGVDPSPARDDATEALYWADLTQAWHRDFRRKVLVYATPGDRQGSAVLFDMRQSAPGGRQRLRMFTLAAEETVQAIDQDASLIWDGHPMLRIHAHNSKARANEFGVSLSKVTRDSSKLIDLAVCMVGARLGRKLALASGKVRRKRTSRQVVIMS